MDFDFPPANSNTNGEEAYRTPMKQEAVNEAPSSELQTAEIIPPIQHEEASSNDPEAVASNSDSVTAAVNRDPESSTKPKRIMRCVVKHCGKLCKHCADICDGHRYALVTSLSEGDQSLKNALEKLKRGPKVMDLPKVSRCVVRCQHGNICRKCTDGCRRSRQMLCLNDHQVESFFQSIESWVEQEGIRQPSTMTTDEFDRLCVTFIQGIER